MSRQTEERSQRQWDWFWVAVVMLIAFDVVRHLVTIGSGPGPLARDAVGYWEGGQRVVEGDWLQRAKSAPYRTPVYNYVVALHRGLFGRYALLALVVFQHVCVFATSLMTGWTAARLSKNRWAFVIAYGLNLLFVARLWHANLVLTDTLFILLLTVGLATTLLYHAAPSRRLAATAGFFLGLAIVVRPVPQLLAPVLAVTMFLHAWGRSPRQSMKTSWWHAISFLIPIALLLLPCFARNQVVHGEFFLTKLPAVNKWAVTFHPPSCADLDWPDSPAARELTAALGQSNNQLEDRYSYGIRTALIESGLEVEEVEALMSRAAYSAIAAEPVRFGWAATKRMVNFWRCVVNDPPYGMGDEGDLGGQYDWSVASIAHRFDESVRYLPSRSLWFNQCFSLVAWLAMVSLIVKQGVRPIYIAMALTFLYFCTLTGLVEIESYRYRMVLEPMMLIAIAQRLTHRQCNSEAC